METTTRKITTLMDLRGLEPEDRERLAGLPLPEKYVIKRVIGHGGMKTILLAHDREAGRDVALAIMNNPEDSSGRERFFNEARITSQLEHPNIVPLHEMSLDRKMPYFTMRYTGGDDLATILDALGDHDAEYEKKYPLRVLLDIYLKVCDAVAFAHSKGIIHLDLKPENIKVGDYGEVLVLDWGLAKQRESAEKYGPGDTFHFDQARLTIDGIIKGTPSYMAPEQAAGKNSRRGYRTDVYALGGILYSILTYRVPVEGATPEETIHNALRGQIRAARQNSRNKKDWPLPLEYIVYKAMEAKPSNRYASVGDLQADVKAYLSGFATTAENADIMTRGYLFVKRNKTVLQSVLLVFLLMYGVSGIFLRTMDSELKTATDNLADAERMQRRNARMGMPKEEPQNWDLVFEDTFDDPYIGERWTLSPAVRTGTEKSSGTETGDVNGYHVRSSVTARQMRYMDELPPDNLRIVLELTSLAAKPASLDLNLSGVTDAETFRIRFSGGEDNSVSVLNGEGKLLAAPAAARLDPGVRQCVEVMLMDTEENRQELQVRRNGEETIRVELEKTYFSGAKMYRLTLEPGKETDLYFHHFQVYSSLPPGAKNDIIAMARKQLARGNYKSAREMFEDIEQNAEEADRKLEAGKWRIRTELLEQYGGGLERKIREMSGRMPGAKIRIVSEKPGLNVMLWGKNVMDLTSLRGLPVTSLSLYDARIRDWSALAQLPLERLELVRSAGAADLRLPVNTELKELKLDQVDMPDPEVLKVMKLRGLCIANAGKLKHEEQVLKAIAEIGTLERLALPNCGISNLEELSKLHLKELDLGRNRISNISALANMPLEYLDLSGNLLRQVPQLATLGELQELNLSENAVTQLILPETGHLVKLKADANRISDLSGLMNQTKLKILSLRNNQIRDLQGLVPLKRLEELYVDFNQIVDLKPLWRSRRLRVLTCSNNSIATLDALSGLYRLRRLDCSDNLVDNLTPLLMTPLEYLNVWNCVIRDFGPVAERRQEKQVLFDPETLEDKALRQAHGQMLTGQTGKLGDVVRVLKKYRAKDYQSLEQELHEAEGGRVLLLPYPATYAEAQKIARELRAELPEFRREESYRRAGRLSGMPYWIQNPRPEQLKSKRYLIIDRMPVIFADTLSFCGAYFDPEQNEVCYSYSRQERLPVILLWRDGKYPATR